MGVAIHWLIQLLVDSQVETVVIDPVALPGDSQAVAVDDVVVSYANSKHLFIQAKKSQPEQRAWAISDTLMREELLKALRQTEGRPEARVEFWSHSDRSFRSIVTDQSGRLC